MPDKPTPPAPAYEPDPRRQYGYAGFLAWLGRKQHARKLVRTPNPVRKVSSTDLSRLADLLFPWTAYEYPGRIAMCAYVLGVASSTARKLMSPPAKLGPSHKRRVIAYLSAKRAAIDALISELSR